MHPPQLRHTYLQCGAETDRRAQPAHRPEHLFRQPARILARVRPGRKYMDVNAADH